MAMYLGDFLEDATVYIPFTTNAADGGRESFSASLEEADIVVLKDGAAMTLDASTITISLDLNSRVGFHVIAIDMSNDADFTTGAEYAAMLYASDETLDGQAPAGLLATWSCENRVVDVARMNGSDITKSSDNRLQVDVAEWNDVPLSTTNPLPNATAGGNGGVPTVDASNYVAGVQGTINTLDALDTAQDTQHSTTQSRIGTPSDFGSGTSTLAANLQDIADNGTATFDRSTDSLQALRDHIGDGTNLTEAGGDGDHLTEAGGTGDQLSAIPWNASWDAEVQSEVTDSLVAHNLDHLCLTATGAADMTTEVADNTILSRILANGDTSAFDPSTDGLQPIRDALPTVAAIFAGGDVDGYTLEESLKLILSACVGVLAGAGSNSITIEAADGSKTRITATVDSSGNRSVVVLDETG